jgi:hypothetical protein
MPKTTRKALKQKKLKINTHKISSVNFLSFLFSNELNAN